MYSSPSYLMAGDQSLVVEFGNSIDVETNRRVQDFTRTLDDQELPGVLDVIPTYRSLLIEFDQDIVTADKLVALVGRVERELDTRPPRRLRVLEIPTLYGVDMAPDIGFVAENAGISEDQLVDLHSGVDYFVYMIGFTPGFVYLGELPDALSTPRLATPRLQTPAGSVGIAGKQTGIYPITTPGGWHIIGRTPLNLFDPHREPPVPLEPGDYVRFIPLGSQAEFDELAVNVSQLDYRHEYLSTPK